MTKRRRPLVIFLLSGGTGRTCEQVLGAALAQFEDPHVKLVRRLRVRSVEAAVKAVQQAAKNTGILYHSLVVPEVRSAVVTTAEQLGVPAVDVLGPTLTLLEDRLTQPPRRQPGLAYELNKEQFDRIDAVDFTLAHDDGIRVAELDKADVVLVGVSRVSKSVTCFYLATRGLRAANVPLLPGTDPPDSLIELDPSRVFGLTMNKHRLTSLREARMSRFPGGTADSYVDPENISRELRWARQLMHRHQWQCVDVSYKAVEETAAEIGRWLESADRQSQHAVGVGNRARAT